MNCVSLISAILQLVAGIGIFLIACTMMSANLESISGNKLKSLFGKVSKNKLMGVGIGALGTATIQSSGATSVMVIGFVNAGIMSLTQAATIIYGANIGTTITGQIVALGLYGRNMISTTLIFSAFAGIGAFVLAFSKKDKWKKIGGICAGFGMLFVGLSMMSSSMESFAHMQSVKLFLASINNGILLVIIGAIFTAIIQSSSVMTSVAIAMVVTNLISLQQGIFITMGSNIGSCVVAVIAGLTSNRNAKRTALIHLIFNISGVVFFMFAGWLLSTFSSGTITFAKIFERIFPNVVQTQLAMFHTAFNVITVIIILPLTKALVSFATKIIPDKKSDTDDENALHTHYISEHMLKTPQLAVQQLKNEIISMSKMAMKNWQLALHIICTQDFSQIEEFTKREEKINFINKEIVRFCVKLSELPLTEKDYIYLSTVFHSTSDLERVGDYAENVVEYAQSLKNINGKFSQEAVEEILALQEKIEDLFNTMIETYSKTSFEGLKKAEEIEEEIDDLTNDMSENHIKRLSEGVCTPSIGAQYLSLSSNAERVADHFMNIAKTIEEYA